MHTRKESREGTILVTAGLAVPTMVISIIGIAILWPAYTTYFLIALLVEVLVTVIAIPLAIGRSFLSRRRTSASRPTGNTPPFWIRMNDFYSLFAILDVLIALIFAYASGYSPYHQQIALLLMGLFFSISYLISFMFRDVYLDFLDASFRYPIGRPVTLLWLNSSLARVFIALRLERGVTYLEKSLEAAKEMIEAAGQSSMDVDRAIGLTRLVSDTGIPPNYDLLFPFVNAVFGALPRFDRLPEESRNLVNAHEWFSNFIAPEGRNARSERGLISILVQVGRILGALGIGSVLVAIIQHPPTALSGLQSWLGSEQAAILTVFSAVFLSYFPAIHLWRQLNMFVMLSDLDIYEANLNAQPVGQHV